MDRVNQKSEWQVQYSQRAGITQLTCIYCWLLKVDTLGICSNALRLLYAHCNSGPTRRAVGVAVLLSSRNTNVGVIGDAETPSVVEHDASDLGCSPVRANAQDSGLVTQQL